MKKYLWMLFAGFALIHVPMGTIVAMFGIDFTVGANIQATVGYLCVIVAGIGLGKRSPSMTAAAALAVVAIGVQWLFTLFPTLMGNERAYAAIAIAGVFVPMLTYWQVFGGEGELAIASGVSDQSDKARGTRIPLMVGALADLGTVFVSMVSMAMYSKTDMSDMMQVMYIGQKNSNTMIGIGLLSIVLIIVSLVCAIMALASLGKRAVKLPNRIPDQIDDRFRAAPTQPPETQPVAAVQEAAVQEDVQAEQEDVQAEWEDVQVEQEDAQVEQEDVQAEPEPQEPEPRGKD